MRLIPMLTFIIAAAALSPLLSAQDAVRHGRWEVSMQMDMPGMPMKMPPIKTTQCITPEEASDPQQAVPKGPNDKDCKMTDQKVDGNKVSWTMKCADGTSGQGEITYATNAYDGWMKMTTQAGAMTVKYTAKRLGDCTK
jgi:hypothetical protein